MTHLFRGARRVGVAIIVTGGMLLSLTSTSLFAAMIPEVFARNLFLGSRGEDVCQLQVFLNTHGSPVAATGIGSLGQESVVYGLRTQAAVRAYQNAYKKEIGIPFGTGYFGPRTRAYVNGLLAPGGEAPSVSEEAPVAPLPPKPLTYTVGGTIVGGRGTLSLTLNDQETRSVDLASHTTFAFMRRLAEGEVYRVTVVDPVGQTCSGETSGVIAGHDVTDLLVTCHDIAGGEPLSSVPSGEKTYALGGTVTGVRGVVVFGNTNGDTVTVTEDGSDTFVFPTRLPTGATYRIGVVSAPEGEVCYTNSTGGTILDADASIKIICTFSWAPNPFFPKGSSRISTYTIGGTLSGLLGSVTLQNNGGDNLVLTTNGAFVFSLPLLLDASYEVTVMTQPDGQTCNVTNGAGTVASHVTNVSVACTDTPVDACAGDPCQNGGICSQVGDGFSCECGPCFSGVTCEIFNAELCA